MQEPADFRIGINLGDVIEEEGRLYGDGVIIAARVEGLAEAGGICLFTIVIFTLRPPYAVTETHALPAASGLWSLTRSIVYERRLRPLGG
jgi:class 3 adenylate cyclase